jgi:Rrf2 family protein
MSYIGVGVEYALHCLLWIAGPMEETPSARDLAELQGVSPSFVSKIFSKLEKAGIVEGSDGIKGGYRLARPVGEVTVLDVIDAVDGHKPLFDCQEVRRRCALYNGKPPKWATQGVCGIHAVMLQAEKNLRAELSQTRLSDLSEGFQTKRLPAGFASQVQGWFADRQANREQTRVAAVRGRSSRSGTETH